MDNLRIKASETTRERTILDKFITIVNTLRYYITEPIMLRMARLMKEREYQEEDNNPKISIYVPTYNRDKILLERAVKSVLDQSYDNFELIIVGDCCTDNTEKYVKSIKDGRIIFHNIKERGYRYPPTIENHWFAGPVIAANKGIELVSGKWIARIDDDDIWTPDHIESLLRFAQNGGYEFVSAQSYVERFGKGYIESGNRARSPYYGFSDTRYNGYNPRIGGTSTWLYRSYLSFFRYNINCWRKNWNCVNDIDLSIRMFNAGVRMGFLEKVVLHYIPRPGEKTVGLDAYKLLQEGKLKHFRFSE